MTRRWQAATRPTAYSRRVGDRNSQASYLAEVAARLPGRQRARRDILAELGAGLADAADGYRATGLEQDRAYRAAIDEFGRPEQVADGFRAELAAVQARRSAGALLASGPVIGALWTAAALSSHLAAPWHLSGLPAGARPGLQLFVIALGVAAIGALVTLATTGRLTRWLPGRPAASAGIAACATAGVDVALLTVAATLAASAPGRLALFPVAAAAVASLARFTLATRAARCCLVLSR
jgi:hypothetical protein